MPPIDKKWVLKDPPNSERTHHLKEVLGLDENLCALLVDRGISSYEEARLFFKPDLKDLHDPYLMKDMNEAVERIEQALKKGERILVYGDYDVDGTTAVSLMYSYLRTIHDEVAYYIPDRYAEGYGVSYQGIDFAADNGIDLIIALDCGIKAIDKVSYASEKGIDFIICDHHRPGKELPNAIAVLDPKRVDCNYPYDELCGCGVGFKLVQALASNRSQSVSELLPYFDLLAVAIAADIVPISGENRILTQFGLQRINSNPRPGIDAMLNDLKKESYTITDVVFGIAPRINAAGRIKHGNFAVQLLIEKDPAKALEYAAEIRGYNDFRKDLDKQITQEALEQIESNGEQDLNTTVVYDEDWHKGVIGIVASRLIENYYRPTLVFTKSGDRLAASARSVKGFDIYQALESCSEHIEQFGGHKYAAGLTLEPKKYNDFKAAFETVVSRTLDEALKTPVIRIDQSLFLSSINDKFNRILKRFAPFGPANMKPVFLATGLRDNGYGKCVGDQGDHLKLSIVVGSNPKTYNAIGFGLGHKYPLIQSGKPFKAVFNIEENHWNGITSIQLNLKDIKAED